MKKEERLTRKDARMKAVPNEAPLYLEGENAVTLLPEEDGIAARESAAYLIGDALLASLCEGTGLTREEAALLLLEGGAAPDAFEALSARAASEIAKRADAGTLAYAPEMYAGSADFAAMLASMPVAAALRLFESEQRTREAQDALEQARLAGAQDVIEKLIARRALPKSTRPGMPAVTETDYMDLSSENFRALRENLMRASAEGKKMKL